MVACFWLMPFFLDNLAGGLARSFAAPLLAFFWLGWLARRPGIMGAALLLQALFIPYIFLVAALAALLAWLLARLGRDSPPPFPAQAAHFLLLGLGAALGVAMNLKFSADGYGPLVRAQEMVNHPEFYAYGRFPILPEPSLLWELISPWEFISPFREWGPVAGALVCAGLLALVAAGLRRLDWPTWRQSLQPVWYLGLASLALYCLARLFLLKLFVPDRYLMYTLNLFYCLVLALGVQTALRVSRWPRSCGDPGPGGGSLTGRLAPRGSRAQGLLGLPRRLCRPGRNGQGCPHRRPPQLDGHHPDLRPTPGLCHL